MNRFCSLVFIHLLFFILPCNTTFSQSRKIDSLQNILKIVKEDTNKINIFNLLFLEYEFNDFEKAKEYVGKALELSQKIDYKKGLADSYTHLGFLAQDKSNCQQAGIYYKQSLKISEELNDKKGIATSLCNMGNVYFEQCDYPKALEYFFKALKISEELGDKQPIAIKLANIGAVYLRQDDYPKALEYYFKALKTDESLGDKNAISPDLNNIGIIYDKQGDYTKALEYCFKALKIAEELGNKNWMASPLGSIGNVYYNMRKNPKLSPLESDSLFRSASKYYFDALNIYEELGNKIGIVTQLCNIGRLYATTKRYKEAEEYLKKGLAISTAIGFHDHAKNTLWSLSTLYEQTNQPIKALEYYKQYVVVNDSIFNETKSRQIAEMQTKYEVEKKEKELELLIKENEIAEYKTFFLISILLFVSLLSILLISRQRIKISKQKEAHQLEQRLIQAKLERNKLETQHLQSNLELKQEKLVNYTNLIKEKTRILDKMQQELDHIRQKNNGQDEPTAEQLLKTVKESINPEQYWEEFITNFNLVYKDFLDQLKSEFPDLTRNELRFCALLKCNLGNKEIANILHITPDSVKKSRTRIRKKFELDANKNLTKFILDIN